jgi:tetratricopeptide (TPR) repeat protein
MATKTEARQFEKQVRSGPFSSEDCLKAARLWQSAGDDWKAIDWYKEVIGCDAEHITARLELATLYNQKLLLHAEALEELEKASAVAPTHEAVLEQLIFTLYELGTIYQSNAKTETKTQYLTRALETAEALLKVNSNNIIGNCYQGRCLCLTDQSKPDEAEKALQRALELDPTHALTTYFLALLRIEAANFHEGIRLMEEAYNLTKDKALQQSISSAIWHYRELAASSKRLHLHRGTSVEKQLETLSECGINIKNGLTINDVLKLSVSGRQLLEQEDPFQALLLNLVNNDLVENGFSWDMECIEGQGDYVRFFEKLRDTARGELDFEKLEDEVYLDELESANKQRLSVQFALDGKKYKWHPKRDNDWLDPKVLNKIGALMIKLQRKQRLVAVPTQTQCICLLVMDAAKVEELAARTDLDIELLR